MAYVKITDLSFAQTLTGNEILPVVQNGTSYKVSVSAVGGTGDTENINGRCNDIGTGCNYSSIVGGECNDVYGNCSFIGGGSVNVLSADFGFIGGGTGNTVYSIGGFVGGGAGNDTCPNTCLDTIGGGNGNVVNSGFKFSFIGGGKSNFMETGNSCASANSSFNNQGNTIVGGNQNSIGTKGNSLKGIPPMTKDLCHNTIVGGYLNKIYKFGTVANPLPDEDIESKYSFVGGGLNNRLNGNYTTIVGGTNNKIYSGVKGGFIGGGTFNTVRSVSGTSGGNYSTIVGGTVNLLSSSSYGFIGGGRFNQLSGADGIGHNMNIDSVIVGGKSNKVNSRAGSILGGQGNYICVNSIFSTINGGESNKIGKGIRRGSINGGFANIIQSDSERNTCSCMYCFESNNIAGGRQNNIGGTYDPILGGPRLSADFKFNIIAGGYLNLIGGNEIHNFPNENCNTSCNFIGGGVVNRMNGMYSLIGGGYSNSIFSNISGSNILGGAKNNIRTQPLLNDSSFSSIVGGCNNNLSASFSFIAGGCSNNIKSDHSNAQILGSDITTVSGNMLHAQTLYLSAAALPTSDPGVPGVVWRDGTDLKISV